MTVATTASWISVEGNGVLTNFEYNFLIPFQSDGTTPACQVFYTPVATPPAVAIPVLLATSAYVITGVGAPTGGSVVYNPSGVPIPVGAYITIVRTTAYTQPDAFSNQSFLPTAVESLGDLLELQIQQLQAGLLRTVQVPFGMQMTAIQYLEYVLDLSTSGGLPVTYSTTAALLATAPSGLVLGTTYVTGGRDIAGDGGGGVFVLVASGAENYGTLRLDWLARPWQLDYIGAVAPEWFGAKGDALQIYDAVVTGTAVSSALRPFVAADIGKTIVIYLAGATIANGRDDSFIGTIIAVPAGVATLNTAVIHNIGANGIAAFGTDDTVAINRALPATPSQGALQLSRGYLMTGTFHQGNATQNWCHNILGIGLPSIYFAIPNHAANCFERKAYFGGNGYTRMKISGALNLDFMATGLDGQITLGGYQIFEENVTTNRAYRNGKSFDADTNNFIQQVEIINPTLLSSGLHNLFVRAHAASGTLGFIDEAAWKGFDNHAWGLCSGAFGVTGNQCGAAGYFISVGAGTDNFIQGWEFSGPFEVSSDRVTADNFGSTQNPNAFFWADGTQPNVLWGQDAGSLLSAYRRWTFIAPQIEDATSGAAQAGAVFAGQTSSLAFLAMNLDYPLNSGAYTSITSNISFTDSNGNRIKSSPGGVSVIQEGSLYIGQELRASGTVAFAAGSGVGISYDGTSGIVQAKNNQSGAALPLVIGGSKYSLTLGSLGNFANDAAAATGGVAVAQLYRNGSIIMIRVV